MKNPSYLTLPDRKVISEMYKAGKRVEEIASKLKTSTATIYRELDRGATGILDELQRPVYDVNIADAAAKEALRRRGRRRKAAKISE